MTRSHRKGLLFLIACLGSIPSAISQPRANDGLARMIAELELRVALDELERVCDLSADQYARLEAAGAIAAKKDIAPRIPIERDEDWRSSPFEDLSDGQVIRVLRAGPHHVHLNDRSDWTAALETVLNPAQLRSAAVARANRATRQRTALAERLVAAIREELRLEPAQTARLVDVLRRRFASEAGALQLATQSFAPPRTFANDEFLPAALTSIRNSDVGRVLSAAQLQLWLAWKREVFRAKFYESGLEQFDFRTVRHQETLAVVAQEVGPKLETDEVVAELRVASELNRLEEAVQLDDLQRKKLRLVAIEIVQRMHDAPPPSEIETMGLESVTSINGDSPDDLYRSMPHVYSLSSESIGPQRLLRSAPAWQRARSLLLGEEQLAAARAAEQEELIERRETVVGQILAEIDERLLLSEEQRELFLRLLQDSIAIEDNGWVESVAATLIEPKTSCSPGLIASILLLPTGQARSLLTANQWRLWNLLRKNFLASHWEDTLARAHGSFVIEKDSEGLSMRFRVSN